MAARGRRAEQLGADVVGDDHLARDDAVEQQQADVVGARALEARDVPHADAEPVDADDELALGLLAAGAREQTGEIGVCLEEPDGFGWGCLHHGSRASPLRGVPAGTSGVAVRPALPREPLKVALPKEAR